MAIDGRRVQAVFLAALEAPPGGRPAVLDRECGGDGELRRRVEALLLAHEEPGSFLARPAAVLAPDAPPVTNLSPGHGPQRPGLEVDSAIDRYRLLQELGEGGMGTVYVAEQQRPVRRKVALKLIKAGMDTRQVIARFEAERQALALMDHPNIAKVLDGGATAQGRPYFVMELVPGVPITKYCDELHLPVRERLALFVPVCAAIHHAHQKGIIHRDVKPSNVLVCLQDGKPVPKVIDFGIAKATDQRLADASMDTALGQMIGTPEYMSPEQAEVSPLGVDTRSDVYSLGALLYELLTGTAPLDKGRLRGASYAEILRLVREEEPPRPSTRLTQSKGTLNEAAARRRTPPGRLARELRGELDWIVMKALDKDRTRRYETVLGLARDVERYLADEPVEAGPPSAAYRLRKLVRRRKGPVLAAAAMLLLLVGGIVGTTWGLVRANEARREQAKRADAERLARGQADDAEADTGAFARFLADDILAATRPEGVQQGLGVNVTMAEALARAEGKIDAAFAGRPRAEALARHEIGVTWATLGRYASAERHLRRAAELRRQHLGADHPLTLASMTSLAAALSQGGRFYRALPLREQIVSLCRARLGDGHPDTLREQSHLAAVCLEAGQIGRSVRVQEEAVKGLEAKLGEGHPDTLRACNRLAVAYQAAGRRDRVLPLLERTLKAYLVKLGEGHPETVRASNELALAYAAAGKRGLVLPLLKRAHQAAEARLGADHPEAIAGRMNLAAAHLSAGAPALAVPLFESAVKACEACLGDDHPLTLNARGNLANAYGDIGKAALAVGLLRRVLAVREATLEADHPDVLTTRNNLAMAHKALGQLGVAVPLLDRNWKARQARLGDDHPDTLTSCNNLAQACQDQGRLEQARGLYEQALARRRKKLGADHPATLGTMSDLALVRLQLGQFEQALRLGEEVLARSKEALGPDHPEALTALSNLAAILWKAGQFDRAAPLVEQALARRREKLGPHHPDTLHSLGQMARLHLRAGRRGAAVRLGEEALARSRAALGAGHPATLAAADELATTYRLAGRPGAALRLARHALEGRHVALGPDHLHTLLAMNNLAVVYLFAGRPQTARPLLERAVVLRRERLPADHVESLSLVENLANLYASLKQWARAIALLVEVVETRKAKQGAAHPDTMGAMATLALACMDDGQFTRAVPLLEEMHRQSRRPAWVGDALLEAYVKAGQAEEAEALVRERIAAARRQHDADSPQLAGALSAGGAALLAVKSFARAEAVLRESLTIRQKKQPEAWGTFSTMSMLGAALLGQGKTGEARRLIVGGYEGLKQRQAEVPPRFRAARVTEALERMVQLCEATGQKERAAGWRKELAAMRSAGKKAGR